MVEAKRQTSTCSLPIKKTQSFVGLQIVSLDTPIPSLPPAEELLDPPDPKELDRGLQKINASIRKLRQRLRKIEAAGEAAGEAALSPEELKAKAQDMKGKRSELNKQRELLEQRDKAMRKEIIKDTNYPKLQKCKKKFTLHQAIQLKESINNKINTATIPPEKEALLIKELSFIAQTVRKMSEREKMEREIESLWKQVHELTDKVEELEKKITECNSTLSTVEEQKADISLIKELKDEIEKLYEEKRKLRADHNAAFKRYKDQQAQYQRAKLVAKRKQELIKLRAQEAKDKKIQMAKCQELIDTCEKVMTKYHKAPSDENPQNDSNADYGKKLKGKKKKKKKQKKAETLVTALELDVLRDQFASFELPAPTGKSDLASAIRSLYGKLKEIGKKPLSESIPLYPHKWEEPESFENLSFSSLSLETTQDFGDFEHVGD